MSINISSYSWNKSFLCSVPLPTGVQMAGFMWQPLFTIQPHRGPWDATNGAHTGRQPLGQRHLSRRARRARKGHTLKVHGLTYILHLGPAVGSWASPGGPQRRRLDPRDCRVCSAQAYTKCPKLAVELKTSTKQILPYHEGPLQSFACPWASASWVSKHPSFYSDGQPLITGDAALWAPQWLNYRSRIFGGEGRGETERKHFPPNNPPQKPLLSLSPAKIAFAENVNRLFLELELCRHLKLILTGHFA